MVKTIEYLSLSALAYADFKKSDRRLLFISIPLPSVGSVELLIMNMREIFLHSTTISHHCYFVV